MARLKPEQALINFVKEMNLELLGYEPVEMHLNLYADDFKKFDIWENIIQTLGIKEAREVTLSICGIKSI